jgi:transcriptional regulator with PAS, ATPase and Fis domain
VVARAIHDRSPRRSGPFVAINCAALVETLLESELFGYEKGAFTGAARTRPGKFESADGGTLFLDEIGDLSPALQAKILRVLQDRTFYRVGGTRPITVDARLLAATHRDLAQAIRESRFREDLYYRLSVVTIRVPPLRERLEDIPILVLHFLDRVRAKTRTRVRSVSEGALEVLKGYAWPGNVRELENVIERAAILTDGDRIEVGSLPEEIRNPRSQPESELPVNLEEAEKVCIARALRITGGKKGEAAKLLGISWPTLNKKLKDYGLESGGGQG